MHFPITLNYGYQDSPAGNYMFKANNRNTRKGKKYVKS